MSDAPVPVQSFLRRVVAPAVAIVILYASIRALPAILVSQAPPIDGGDLIVVFLVSLVIFWGWSVYLDRRHDSEEPEE